MPSVRHRGRHLAFVETDAGWEFCTRTVATAAVMVLAATPEGLLLVEQFRPPVGRRVVELPAGLSGDLGPEDLATAAKRELEEETGWTAESFQHLTTGPSSAGLTDEQIALFRASGLRRIGPGGGDASEDIAVHTVPISEVFSFLREREAAGCQIDPKVWAGLYWLHAPG
ncbi:MAG: ADP-ribose pyrophosphatase [Myxococcota bacterium]|jgi:ADP-ribose pyrophosphatase